MGDYSRHISSRRNRRSIVFPSLILLLVIALGVGFLAFPFAATKQEKAERSAPVNGVWFDVYATLERSDLNALRVTIWLAIQVHFDYNTTFDNITVGLIQGVYDPGFYYLNKTHSSESDCWFTGAFHPDAYPYGSPELYPFDTYSVNVTLEVGRVSAKTQLRNAELYSFLRGWELLQTSHAVTDQDNLNLVFLFRRSLWQSVPIMMPILIGFIALGFSSLVGTRTREGYGQRIEIYMALLIWSVGFAFFTKPLIPTSVQFLSLAESLGHALVTAILSYLIFTILSRELNISLPASDFFALLMSFGLTALLLESIWAYTYYDWVIAYPLITGLVVGLGLVLSTGLLIRGIRYLYRYPSSHGFTRPRITSAQLRRKSWFLYWGAVFANFLCVGLTIYWVYVYGPGVEMTWARRILFELTFENPWLMILVQSLVTAASILPLYYAPRISIWRGWTSQTSRELTQIANAFGLFFFLMSIADLLNDTGLLPIYLAWSFVAALVTCGAVTAVFFVCFVSDARSSPQRLTSSRRKRARPAG